jgi:hypothetical protein
MPRLQFVLVIAALTAGRAVHAVQAPAGATDALLAAERVMSEASAHGTFVAAIAGALTENGAILWPGAPIVSGPDPVRRLLAAQRLLDSLRITWQPLGAMASADGTAGATWGVTAAARDGRAPELGRYIAAWQRESGAWKLAAFVPIGIFPAQSTLLPPGSGPLRLPPVASRGTAEDFITADLAFARLAGDSGAAVAFGRYAAPDGFMFAGGTLALGPTAIRGLFEGGPRTAWAWHPVLAGSAASGELGYTVGEAVITPDGGAPRYSKYLTIWQRQPDGKVRFFTDGGNARPATP